MHEKPTNTHLIQFNFIYFAFHQSDTDVELVT
jgi:hypothetical protein